MSAPEELLAGYLQTRTEQAFRMLYRACTPRLMGFALRLAGGDVAEAEELVQETWTRAVRRLESYQEGGALGSWLNGIVVNCWRESRRRTSRQDQLLHDPRGDPDPGTISHLESLDLKQAVASLPEGYRAVLVLHDVEGFTHSEIAGLLGISVGTSKSQLARARRSLRERLLITVAPREV